METVTSLINSLESLCLIGRSTIQTTNPHTEDYVTELDVQTSCTDPLVAVACSNFTISLVSMNSLAHISTISGHSDTVTKVKFGKTEPHLVYSCSKDKSVRCWDTRKSTSKEVKIFQAPEAVKTEILSLDVSQSDRLLCAGTEKVGSDSYLLFWDNRQNSLLGCYSECHQDDITQVCFQPRSDRYLASGSADGLVCIFDLSETSEDDALQITSNAESDVAQIGWCGQDGTSCVYCVTSDNSFHVWGAEEGDSCCTINSFSGAHEGGAEDYIVDCIADLTADGDRSSAVLLTGTHSGHLRLLLCTDQNTETRTLSTLDAGHTMTVRCCHWDRKVCVEVTVKSNSGNESPATGGTSMVGAGNTQTLLTGGEDGLLCLWSTTSGSQIMSKGNRAALEGKVKVKTNISQHSRKPYGKKNK